MLLSNSYHVTYHKDQWINTKQSVSNEETMENNGKFCDYCNRQGNVKMATSWCPECDDRLCKNCVKFHQVNRLTMEHSVYNTAEENQISSVKIDLFCKQHSSNRLEVYCFDHEEPCCLMCATIIHRNCEKVGTLNDCSQKYAKNIPSICAEMEKLRKASVAEIARVRCDMECFKNESKDVEHRIKTMTAKTIIALKEKERVLLENLEKTKLEREFILVKTLDEYLDIRKTVEDSIRILKKNDRLPNIAFLLELMRIGKTVPEIHIYIEELQKNYQTFVVDVHFDDAFTSVHSSSNPFGEIKLKTKHKIDYQSGQLELERSVTVEGSSYLSDADVIDGRYIVTTCEESKMLYSLDVNGRQLSSLKLRGCPWSIAVLQNQCFCVSLRDPGCICILEMQKNLSITTLKELKMPQNVWGICAVEDKIVASIETQGHGQVFRFYDHEGNYSDEHEIAQGESQCGTLHATTSKCILFTHPSGNSIFSVDPDNSEGATKLYSGNNMKYPIGLTCDPEENIYVACFGSNNILQFNGNGKFLREILHKDLSLQNPYGIRVKGLGDNIKLIVTTMDKLLIYRFKQ